MVARVYLRVSTDAQNLERQEGIITAAKAAGYYDFEHRPRRIHRGPRRVLQSLAGREYFEGPIAPRAQRGAADQHRPGRVARPQRWQREHSSAGLSLGQVNRPSPMGRAASALRIS